MILQVYYLGQRDVGCSRKITRKTEILETQILDDLHEAVIHRSFGWDDPHMYSFFFDNTPYSKTRNRESCCFVEPDLFSGESPDPISTKLRKLNLREGQKLPFVFDFGNDHQFGIEEDL